MSSGTKNFVCYIYDLSSAFIVYVVCNLHTHRRLLTYDQSSRLIQRESDHHAPFDSSKNVFPTQNCELLSKQKYAMLTASFILLRIQETVRLRRI